MNEKQESDPVKDSHPSTKKRPRPGEINAVMDKLMPVYFVKSRIPSMVASILMKNFIDPSSIFVGNASKGKKLIEFRAARSTDSVEPHVFIQHISWKEKGWFPPSCPSSCFDLDDKFIKFKEKFTDSFNELNTGVNVAEFIIIGEKREMPTKVKDVRFSLWLQPILLQSHIIYVYIAPHSNILIATFYTCHQDFTIDWATAMKIYSALEMVYNYNFLGDLSGLFSYTLITNKETTRDFCNFVGLAKAIAIAIRSAPYNTQTISPNYGPHAAPEKILIKEPESWFIEIAYSWTSEIKSLKEEGITEEDVIAFCISKKPGVLEEQRKLFTQY